MRTALLLLVALGLVPLTPTATAEEEPLVPFCWFNDVGHNLDRDAVPAGELYGFRYLNACALTSGHVTFGRLQIPLTFVHYPWHDPDVGLWLLEIQFALPNGTPVGTYRLPAFAIYDYGGSVQFSVEATVTPPTTKARTEAAAPTLPQSPAPAQVTTSHQHGVLCLTAASLTRCTVPDGDRVPDGPLLPSFPGGTSAFRIVLEQETRQGGFDTTTYQSTQATEYRLRLRVYGPDGTMMHNGTYHPARLAELVSTAGPLPPTETLSPDQILFK